MSGRESAIVRPVLLALSAMAIVLASAAGATAAPKWSDGVIANDVLNINCVSSIFNPPGYLENEIAVYTGQYIDDDAANLSPVPGEVFDVHVVVGTVGNNCAGTAPRIEIALPPGVEPAVSQANAIRCYFSPDFTNWNQITQAQGCPASVGTGVTSHPSISTWYGLNPDSGYGSPLWLLAQGTAIEIQVPVVADRQMIGIGDPGGCVCVVASVSTLNGESRPDNFFTWSSGFPSSGAYQHLFVFPPKKSPEPDKLGVKVRVPKQSLRRITRRGQIAATCTTTRNGSCGTVATVSRADARRLGLKMLKKPGRVKVGTGASEATKAGKAVAVPVRIAANAKGPLRRSKRPVRIQITATAKSPGTSTATARTVLTARP